MRNVIGSGEYKVNADVIKLVQDNRFEQEVLNFVLCFDGICELINKCQKSNFTIADALEEWLSLNFPVDNDA